MNRMKLPNSLKKQSTAGKHESEIENLKREMSELYDIMLHLKGTLDKSSRYCTRVLQQEQFGRAELRRLKRIIDETEEQSVVTKNQVLGNRTLS